MGVLGTYYFDGVSFANASMVYTNSTLTAVASNGYYGQNGIVRQLIGGPSNPTLLQPLPCDNCSIPCGSGVNGSGGTGKFFLTLNLGNSIGASKVTFNPQSVPDKCTWTYNSVSASEYSSPSEGYLQGMIGTISNASSCNLSMSNANGSNGATTTGGTFQYDSGTNQFVNTGTPATLGPYGNQASGGVSFTTNAPGNTVMVIPKPNASPENVSFTIEGPCSGTAWSIAVLCPQALTSFACTQSGNNCTVACEYANFDLPVFNMPVSGSAGVPAVNDWVFTDANGVNELINGQYSTVISGTRRCMTVANGVITSLVVCI